MFPPADVSLTHLARPGFSANAEAVMVAPCSSAVTRYLQFSIPFARCQGLAMEDLSDFLLGKILLKPGWKALKDSRHSRPT